MKRLDATPLKYWVLSTLATVVLSTGAHAEIEFQPLQLPEGASGWGGTDMNAAGVMVGGIFLNGQSEPAVWLSREELPTILPTEGRGGVASAINSAGQVVGATFDGPVGGSPTLWENQVSVLLPHLGEGGDARDISESGIIVGSVIVNGEFVAARWVNRELQLLPLETEQIGEVGFSIASSINSSDVISGTIRKPNSTESLAVRWDADGIEPALDSGLETKGISIDNLGGVLVNGYFDGGYTSQPARVLPDGTLDILAAPAGYTYYGVAMSRTGVVSGYYFDSSSENAEEWSLKAVAWVDGEFTALELPEGQRYAIPLGVGINGVVIGVVTDDNSVATPGFWELPVEQTQLRSRSLTAAPGQTMQLTTTSSRASGVNVGQSVQVSVAGQLIRTVTNDEGVASVPFTIPARTKSSALTVQFIDETGASTRETIRIASRPTRPIRRGVDTRRSNIPPAGLYPGKPRPANDATREKQIPFSPPPGRVQGKIEMKLP